MPRKDDRYTSTGMLAATAVALLVAARCETPSVAPGSRDGGIDGGSGGGTATPDSGLPGPTAPDGGGAADGSSGPGPTARGDAMTDGSTRADGAPSDGPGVGSDGEGGAEGPDGPGSAGPDASTTGDGEGDGSPVLSLVCNDGIRDPVLEECDDGTPGDDSCTDTCRIRDLLVAPRPLLTDGGHLPGRALGQGRHPVAATSSTMGVTLVDIESDPPVVRIQTFDAAGARSGVPVSVGEGSRPVTRANPAIAPLPDGRFAVVWTDFDPGFPNATDPVVHGDGDALGIALRAVDPTSGALGALKHANAGTFPDSYLAGWTPADFSQFDPDVIATGNRVVVAWTDDADAFNGPDIRFRLFDAALTAQSKVLTLADSLASESHVALCATEDGFAAAWRSAVSGAETIEVRAFDREGTQAHQWYVGPVTSPPASDRPALADIGEGRLVVAFTEATDPSGSGVANTPRLRGAVLAPIQEGLVESYPIEPRHEDYAGDATVAQSHPNVVRVDNRAYVAWRSSRLPGDDRGEEIWLKELAWPAQTVEDVLALEEIRLPRQAEHRAGDQRFPALAATTLAPEGALLTAWEDWALSFGGAEGTPDVVVELIPTPVVRLSDPGGGT